MWAAPLRPRVHQFFAALGLADGSAAVRRLFTSVAAGPAVGGWARVAPAHLACRGDGAWWVLLDAWGLAASRCSSRSLRVARGSGVTRRELDLAHRRSRAPRLLDTFGTVDHDSDGGVAQ